MSQTASSSAFNQFRQHFPPPQPHPIPNYVLPDKRNHGACARFRIRRKTRGAARAHGQSTMPSASDLAQSVARLDRNMIILQDQVLNVATIVGELLSSIHATAAAFSQGMAMGVQCLSPQASNTGPSAPPFQPGSDASGFPPPVSGTSLDDNDLTHCSSSFPLAQPTSALVLAHSPIRPSSSSPNSSVALPKVNPSSPARVADATASALPALRGLFKNKQMARDLPSRSLSPPPSRASQRAKDMSTSLPGLRGRFL